MQGERSSDGDAPPAGRHEPATTAMLPSVEEGEILQATSTGESVSRTSVTIPRFVQFDERGAPTRGAASEQRDASQTTTHDQTTPTLGSRGQAPVPEQRGTFSGLRAPNNSDISGRGALPAEHGGQTPLTFGFSASGDDFSRGVPPVEHDGEAQFPAFQPEDSSTVRCAVCKQAIGTPCGNGVKCRLWWQARNEAGYASWLQRKAAWETARSAARMMDQPTPSPDVQFASLPVTPASVKHEFRAEHAASELSSVEVQEELRQQTYQLSISEAHEQNTVARLRSELQQAEHFLSTSAAQHLEQQNLQTVELSSAENKIGGLQRNCAELEQALTGSDSQLLSIQLNRTVSDLQTERRRLLEECEAWKFSFGQELHARLASSQQVVTLESVLKSSEEALATAEQSSEATIAELTAASVAASANSVGEAQSATIKRLQANLEDAHGTIQRLQTDLDDAREQHAQLLKSSAANAATLGRALYEMEEKVAELREENLALTERLEQCDPVASEEYSPSPSRDSSPSPPVTNMHVIHTPVQSGGVGQGFSTAPSPGAAPPAFAYPVPNTVFPQFPQMMPYMPLAGPQAIYGTPLQRMMGEGVDKLEFSKVTNAPQFKKIRFETDDKKVHENPRIWSKWAASARALAAERHALFGGPAVHFPVQAAVKEHVRWIQAHESDRPSLRVEYEIFRNRPIPVGLLKLDKGESIAMMYMQLESNLTAAMPEQAREFADREAVLRNRKHNIEAGPFALDALVYARRLALPVHSEAKVSYKDRLGKLDSSVQPGELETWIEDEKEYIQVLKDIKVLRGGEDFRPSLDRLCSTFSRGFSGVFHYAHKEWLNKRDDQGRRVNAIDSQFVTEEYYERFREQVLRNCLDTCSGFAVKLKPESDNNNNSAKNDKQQPQPKKKAEPVAAVAQAVEAKDRTPSVKIEPFKKSNGTTTDQVITWVEKQFGVKVQKARGPFFGPDPKPESLGPVYVDVESRGKAESLVKKLNEAKPTFGGQELRAFVDTKRQGEPKKHGKGQGKGKAAGGAAAKPPQ